MKRIQRTLLLATGALAAIHIAAAGAQEQRAGRVKRFPGDLKLLLEPGRLVAQSKDFSPAGAAAGVTSSSAKLTKLKRGRSTMRIAVDTRSGSTPDTLRLDLDGDGRFDAAVPMEFKQTGKTVRRADIAPTTLRVQRGGKRIPVLVRGRYFEINGAPQMRLQLTTGAEATVDFGDQTRQVRILDGNSNARLGDKAAPMPRGAITPGDTIVIDQGDGQFRGDEPRGWYGHPVQVDGRWYVVALSPDERQMTAQVVEIPTAKIVLGHKRWKAHFVGRQYLLNLTGGAGPVEVPADAYRVRRIVQTVPGTRAQLSAWALSKTELKSTNVPAGQTVNVAAGSPLKVSVRTRISGGRVSFSMSLADASGLPVFVVTTAGGNRPPAPRLVIRDAGGKQIYDGRMKYG